MNLVQKYELVHSFRFGEDTRSDITENYLSASPTNIDSDPVEFSWEPIVMGESYGIGTVMRTENIFTAEDTQTHSYADRIGDGCIQKIIKVTVGSDGGPLFNGERVENRMIPNADGSTTRGAKFTLEPGVEYYFDIPKNLIMDFWNEGAQQRVGQGEFPPDGGGGYVGRTFTIYPMNAQWGTTLMYSPNDPLLGVRMPLSRQYVVRRYYTNGRIKLTPRTVRNRGDGVKHEISISIGRTAFNNDNNTLGLPTITYTNPPVWRAGNVGAGVYNQVMRVGFGRCLIPFRNLTNIEVNSRRDKYELSPDGSNFSAAGLQAGITTRSLGGQNALGYFLWRGSPNVMPISDAVSYLIPADTSSNSNVYPESYSSYRYHPKLSPDPSYFFERAVLSTRAKNLKAGDKVEVEWYLGRNFLTRTEKTSQAGEDLIFAYDTGQRWSNSNPNITEASSFKNSKLYFGTVTVGQVQAATSNNEEDYVVEGTINVVMKISRNGVLRKSQLLQKQIPVADEVFSDEEYDKEERLLTVQNEKGKDIQIRGPILFGKENLTVDVLKTTVTATNETVVAGDVKANYLHLLN